MANDNEIMDSSTLILVQEREISMQVETARRYPRQIGRIQSQITAYATEDEGTALECIYAIPRDKKVITGPTVRFAEIVGSAFGNSRYAARMVDEGPRFVTAQGVFHDLENNMAISVEVQRRITSNTGARYGDDMIGVTSNAAMSIALRNAILKGVPRAVWGGAYAKVQALIGGTFETIAARRDAALKQFAKLGVEEELVLKLLDLPDARDIEPEHMLTLRGTLTAIRDGDTTLNQVFADYRSAPRGTKADVGGNLQKGKDNAEQAKKTTAEQGGKAGNDQVGGGERGAADLDKGGADDSARTDDSPFPGDKRSTDGGSAREGGDANASEPRGDSESVRGSADAARVDAGADHDERAGGAVEGEGESLSRGPAEPAEPLTIPPLFDEVIGSTLLTEADTKILAELGHAIAGATSLAEVNRAAAPFNAKLDLLGGEAPSLGLKMVSHMQKTVRANRGKSASEKL